jgi:hypothetical protein
VLSSDDIRSMLAMVQQRQKSGCQEVACLAEIGGALGAKRLVTGSLSKLGDTYLLDVRLVDVDHAQVIKQTSVRIRGKGDEALLDAVSGLVGQLFPQAAAPALALQASPAPEPSRSHALGIGLAAGAVAVAVFAVVAFADSPFNTYLSDQSHHTPLTQSTANSVTSNGNLWMGLGIGAAAVAVAGGTGAVIAW